MIIFIWCWVTKRFALFCIPVRWSGKPARNSSAGMGSFLKYGTDPQEGQLKQDAPGDAGWGEDQPDQYGELATELSGLAVQGEIETRPAATRPLSGTSRSDSEGWPVTRPA